MNLAMVSSVFRRVGRNISTSPYLHLAATASVAFSLLILGVFAILYVNINHLVRSWQDHVRVVAYLADGLSVEEIEALKNTLTRLEGVDQVLYVSKQEAMARLKKQMQYRLSLLEDLEENPLPASLEIRLAGGWKRWEHVKPLIDQIQAFSEFQDLEYGEAWVHRVSGFIGFFKLASLVIGSLILATTVFICTNTIRLTLYAKHEELEIMKLVGATNAFIKAPFYAQNLIQGLLGGLVALALLFTAYRIFMAKVQTSQVLLSTFEILFLTHSGIFTLLSAGILIGWLGSYFSLKQFLKR